MSNPTLVLKNQFGEESVNKVLTGSTEGLPIGANTISANLTGASAVPTGTSTQAVANKLPAKTGVTAISANPAVTIALSTSNTYTDAAVNAAVNAALASVVADINALLAALKVVS